MIHTDLELLRYDGFLSDAEAEDNSWYGKVYDYILEHFKRKAWLKFCSQRSKTHEAGAPVCTAGGGKYGDCAVKVGKEICEETGDTDLCDIVSKAELVNEAAKLAFDDDAKLPEPKVDISTKLNSLVEDFSSIDCSAMTAAQKVDIVNRLNVLEAAFAKDGRQAEFDMIIQKLSCDVVEEFKCGGEDESVTQFAVDPVCKPKFITVWGKPLAIGGATGVATGFAWHKLIKGSVTLAVMAGVLAGAGTTYYIKKRGE